MVNVRILDNGTLSFEGIEAPLFQILQQITKAAESSDPDVEARFYPMPADEADEVCQDWKAYIQPELYTEFLASREAVDADLRRGKKKSDGTASFVIPPPHMDHWLSALNQARLALAEIHHFTEKDMGRSPGDPDDPREFALTQLNIYATMQEWLISTLD
jgi:hypothetical protein